MKIFFVLSLLIGFSSLFAQEIPKDYWSIQACSSEVDEKNNLGGLAKYLIDGKLKTFWINDYSSKTNSFPYSFVISFGGKVELNGLSFYPRFNYAGGKIEDYEVYSSMDLNKWTLLKKSKFKWGKPFDNNPQKISFNPIHAKYIKFVALNSYKWEDSSLAQLSEVEASGKYICSITIPRFQIKNSVVKPNEKVFIQDKSVVVNTGNLHYKWVFKGGVPEVSTEKQPSVVYFKYGIYDVQLTLTNENGTQKSVEVKNAIKCIPSTQLSRINWKIATVSEEDLEHSDFAKNVLDSNEFTIWSTTWFEHKKLPHFITLDLGEEFDIHGVAYLPRQHGINGIFKSYQVYISDDNKNWGNPIVSVNHDIVYHDYDIQGFKTKRGRYLKWVILSSFPINQQYATCSEFFVYGEKVVSRCFLYSGLGIFSFSVLIFFLLRKKRKRSTTEVVNEEVENANPYGIYLFGRFQIFGNEKNYSKDMFQKLRTLFILIAYKTIEENGISRIELTRLLWPKLMPENATSARSSNIRKLRALLEDQDEVKIVVEKDVYRIELSQKVYVDYFRFVQLKKQISNCIAKSILQIELVEEMLHILERGGFCSELENEILDKLKLTVSNEIFNFLLLLLRLPDKNLSSELRLRICSCIFISDEFNMEAIQYKVKLLASDGKMALAQNTYDVFASKYKDVYGEALSMGFSDFLN